MTTCTTEYGTWANYGSSGTCTELRSTVEEALGEYVDQYDVDAIECAYREAINDALPPGVVLNGDDFYGPASPEQGEWDDYPTTDHGRLDIAAIVESVNLWQIIDRHELTDTPTNTPDIEVTADDITALHRARYTSSLGRGYAALAVDAAGELAVVPVMRAVQHGWPVLYDQPRLVDYCGGRELTPDLAEALAGGLNTEITEHGLPDPPPVG